MKEENAPRLSSRQELMERLRFLEEAEVAREREAAERRLRNRRLMRWSVVAVILLLPITSAALPQRVVFNAGGAISAAEMNTNFENLWNQVEAHENSTTLFASKDLPGNQVMDGLTGFVDSEAADFRWRNLSIGSTYVVSGAFHVRDSTFADGVQGHPFNIDIEIDNGGVVIDQLIYQSELAFDSTGADILTYRTRPFTATSSDVRFNVAVNVDTRIMSAGTYTVIEELRFATPTTAFD